MRALGGSWGHLGAQSQESSVCVVLFEGLFGQLAAFSPKRQISMCNSVVFSSVSSWGVFLRRRGEHCKFMRFPRLARRQFHRVLQCFFEVPQKYMILHFFQAFRSICECCRKARKCDVKSRGFLSTKTSKNVFSTIKFTSTLSQKMRPHFHFLPFLRF